MEETNLEDAYSSDLFLDALDEFPTLDVAESEQTVDLSPISRLESVKIRADNAIEASDSPKTSLPSSLRHRSSVRFSREASGTDSKDLSSNSPSFSEISQVCEAITPREKRNKILSALKDHERPRERSNSMRIRSNSDRFSVENELNQESSCISSVTNEKSDKSVAVDSPSGDLDGSNFLALIAGLVIKAIGFQFNLLISFLTFPIWLLYFTYVFVINPFQTLKRGKDLIFEKLSRICSFLCARVSPLIYEKLKGQQSIGKYVMRFGWGFLWAFYVCFMLFCFLVSAFLISGLMMRYFVEEPIRMKETLNFDYTKPNPVALVPIVSCDGVFCGMGCKENIDVVKTLGSHVIPSNHKLQLTVSLILPESDYNRRLGVFQVRVEFLSANGKVTASSIQPCMLHFKSPPIRYVETFLKSGSILTGYSSESQLLSIRMTGFTKGTEPTACLRVILEHRAEYRPGAGIPEIYDASLVLESELPLFKRIIWYWKNTIFIWNSIGLFVTELLLILICCRPIIVPRARPRDGSANRT